MDRLQLVIAVLSLIGAVLGLLAALINRRRTVIVRYENPDVSNLERELVKKGASLGRVPRRSSLSADDIRWYDKPFWVIVWIFLFLPVGYYALYKSRGIHPLLKKIIFFAQLVMIIAATAAQP